MLELAFVVVFAFVTSFVNAFVNDFVFAFILVFVCVVVTVFVFFSFALVRFHMSLICLSYVSSKFRYISNAFQMF